jgi:hypothetical protein
MHKSTKQI